MKMNMHVVFMGNFLYPNGMAETKRIQNAIDYLAGEQTATVQVLLLRQSHAGRDDATLNGIHRGTPYRTIGHDVGLNWHLPIAITRFFFSGVKILAGARRRGCKNVLYVSMDPNIENLAFIVFAKLLGYKIIFDVTEDYYYVGRNAHLASRIKQWTSTFLSKRIGLLADAVLVISSYLQEKFEAISHGRFPVRLLPISVDTGKVYATSNAFHHPLRLLYAGSYGDKDPVEMLIDAVESLCAEGHDLELTMAGRGLPSRMAQIAEKISRSRYKDRMRYLGYLSDEKYFQLLGECDVPCMIRIPSRYAHAGFPFKLGEYLATGKPTVASRVGDVGVFLEDQVSAFLVEPGSTEAIIKALRFVINSPECARSVGERGRKVAEQYFDAKRVGARLVEVMERL